MYCMGMDQPHIDWEELMEEKARKEARNREENREKQRKYIQTWQAEHPEKRREIVKLSQRKRRAEAVKKGLCKCCCKRIPAPERKNCPVCLERAREAQRRKRADIH